jgi:hypothetical protein
LSHQDQPGGQGQVIREILQYFVHHPYAKDTAEGVLKWWLADSQRARREVQAALDLLTSKGWLTKRETAPKKEVYGINKDRLEEIRSFLRKSGTGS